MVAGGDGGYCNAKLTYGWNDHHTFTTEMCLATGIREETSTYHNEKTTIRSMVHVGGEKCSVLGHEKCPERKRNSGYAKPLYKAL